MHLCPCLHPDPTLIQTPTIVPYTSARLPLYPFLTRNCDAPPLSGIYLPNEGHALPLCRLSLSFP